MKHSLLLSSAIALLASGALAMEEGAQIDMDTAMERGAEIYNNVAICSACHAEDGTGGIGPNLEQLPYNPTDIVYQLQTNPQMAGLDEMMAPITANDLFALTVYIDSLYGKSADEEQQAMIFASAEAGVRGLQVVEQDIPMTDYDKLVEQVETWESLVSGWERKAATGSIKHDYQVKVLETFEPGEQIFFPEPGKTYWYENTGAHVPTFAGAHPNDNLTAVTSQIVVGDAETKEVLAHYELPIELKGAVHTTAMTPDGKHVYIIGNKPNESMGGEATLVSPSTLIKADALTLQPVVNYDIGARIHHGQIFRDKYILIDTFARDDDGLDVMLFDPETEEIIGGVRNEELGGAAYTSFTDNEFIYILMEPRGYGADALTGFRAGLAMSAGELVTARPFWIAKVDPDTWEVVDEYPFPGYRGNWITIDSAKEHLFVAAGASSLVTKINLATGEKVWSQRSGIGPYGMTLNADESEIWVADKGETTGMYGRTVTVIDNETGIQKATLFAGYKIDHLLLSPDGKEVWGTSNGEGNVYVWDAQTHEQTHVIDMPGGGDAHGLVFVHYDEDGESKVVRDQGGFHNGIHPAKGLPLN